jgi:RND family efflux transporter MFP subunit
MTPFRTAAVAGLAGMLVFSALGRAADSEGHQCVVKPSMVVDVGSPVQGVLKSIRVDRGDVVKPGDLLVELESSIQAAEFDLAKLRAAFEDRRAGRLDMLARGNLVSPQERDEADTKRQIAQGEVKRAAAELARRSILSPIAGVVVERNNDPGEFVKDSRLVRLAQIDPLTAEALLPASLFPKIRPGMQAEIELQEPGRGRHLAAVTVVDRIIDTPSGTFGVQVSLPNPDLSIPAGILCTLRLTGRSDG